MRIGLRVRVCRPGWQSEAMRMDLESAKPGIKGALQLAKFIS